MYKVHEINGSWAVSRDGEGVTVMGGAVITYEQYKELKSQPHKAANLFERRAGKIIAKVRKKVT